VDEDDQLLSAFEKALSVGGATITATRYAGCAMQIMMRREREMDFVVTGPDTALATGVTLTCALQTMFPDTPVIVVAALGHPKPAQEHHGRRADGRRGAKLSAAKLNDMVRSILLKFKDDSKQVAIAE